MDKKNFLIVLLSLSLSVFAGNTPKKNSSEQNQKKSQFIEEEIEQSDDDQEFWVDAEDNHVQITEDMSWSLAKHYHNFNEYSNNFYVPGTTEVKKYYLKNKPVTHSAVFKIKQFLTSKDLLTVAKTNKVFFQMFCASDGHYPILVPNQTNTELVAHNRGNIEKQKKTFSQNPKAALSPKQTKHFLESYFLNNTFFGTLEANHISQMQPMVLSTKGIAAWGSEYFDQTAVDDAWLERPTSNIDLGARYYFNDFNPNEERPTLIPEENLINTLRGTLLTNPNVFFSFTEYDLKGTSRKLLQLPEFKNKLVSFAGDTLYLLDQPNEPFLLTQPPIRFDARDVVDAPHSLTIPNLSVSIRHGQNLMNRDEIASFMARSHIGSLHFTGFCDTEFATDPARCLETAQAFFQLIQYHPKIDAPKVSLGLGHFPAQAMNTFLRALQRFSKLKSITFKSIETLEEFDLEQIHLPKVETLRFPLTRGFDSFNKQNNILQSKNGVIAFIKNLSIYCNNIRELDITSFIFSAQALNLTPEMLDIFQTFSKLETLNLRVEPNLLINFLEKNSSGKNSFGSAEQDFEAMTPPQSPKNKKKEDDFSEAFSRMSLKEARILAPKKKAVYKSFNFKGSFESLQGETNDSDNDLLGSHYEMHAAKGPDFYLPYEEANLQRENFMHALNQIKTLKTLKLSAKEKLFDEQAQNKIRSYFPHLTVEFPHGCIE